MAEIRATVLTQAVVYDSTGRTIHALPEQDIVAVRIESGDAVTFLVVDRSLLERGGVVRVGG